MGKALGIIGLITSLIGLGVIGALHNFGVLYDIIALVVGIIGATLCSIQQKKEKNGFAKAGSIISWIVIILSIINILLALIILSWGRRFI